MSPSAMKVRDRTEGVRVGDRLRCYAYIIRKCCAAMSALDATLSERAELFSQTISIAVCEKGVVKSNYKITLSEKLRVGQ